MARRNVILTLKVNLILKGVDPVDNRFIEISEF